MTKIRLLCFLCIIGIAFSPRGVDATSPNINDNTSLFPLDNYSQDADKWLPPDAPDANIPVLSAQQQQIYMQEFLKHYFGDLSPWNASFINSVLNKPSPHDLFTIEQHAFDSLKYSEEGNFGENYRSYSIAWFDTILNNMDLAQLKRRTSFESNRRAIATNNLLVRILPTSEVVFTGLGRAGSGYPFDNVQVSAIWAGTPLYILGISQDQSWLFVQSPSVIGWVPNNDIAYTNDAFIQKWTAMAKNKLVAIGRTQLPINVYDSTAVEKGRRFTFNTYIGSVFPSSKSVSYYQGQQWHWLYVPMSDGNKNAFIRRVPIKDQDVVVMPLSPTPNNFSRIIKQMQSRPYGWGNSYLYNDCSAELKSLLTPFGIWLPRHSSDQLSAGETFDLSNKSMEERLLFLQNSAQKLTTLVYIGGHIFLYIGNKTDGTPMTYQNIWGLSPPDRSRRAVIGQSVFFPLLRQYPEDPNLVPLVNYKIFKVSFLDKTGFDNNLIPSIPRVE